MTSCHVPMTFDVCLQQELPPYTIEINLVGKEEALKMKSNMKMV